MALNLTHGKATVKINSSKNFTDVSRRKNVVVFWFLSKWFSTFKLLNVFKVVPIQTDVDLLAGSFLSGQHAFKLPNGYLKAYLKCKCFNRFSFVFKDSVLRNCLFNSTTEHSKCN